MSRRDDVSLQGLLLALRNALTVNTITHVCTHTHKQNTLLITSLTITFSLSARQMKKEGEVPELDPIPLPGCGEAVTENLSPSLSLPLEQSGPVSYLCTWLR